LPPEVDSRTRDSCIRLREALAGSIGHHRVGMPGGRAQSLRPDRHDGRSNGEGRLIGVDCCTVMGRSSTARGARAQARVNASGRTSVQAIAALNLWISASDPNVVATFIPR